MAYTDLMTCRPMGFESLASIPWNVIEQYARTQEFDGDQTANLHFFTRKMDAALIKKDKARGNK